MTDTSVSYRVLSRKSGPCNHRIHALLERAAQCAEERRKERGERTMVVAYQNGRLRPLTDAERLIAGPTR